MYVIRKQKINYTTRRSMKSAWSGDGVITDRSGMIRYFSVHQHYADFFIRDIFNGRASCYSRLRRPETPVILKLHFMGIRMHNYVKDRSTHRQRIDQRSAFNKQRSMYISNRLLQKNKKLKQHNISATILLLHTLCLCMPACVCVCCWPGSDIK